ncbi:hypothetical protein PG984_011959 [Apiospora sp. TS-2023a]
MDSDAVLDSQGVKISARAKTCQQLFSHCLSPTTPRCAEWPAQWLQTRQGEFNLWAYGLQALSTSKASLDHRVRGRDDVRMIILGLLSALCEDLQECLRIDAELSRKTEDATPPIHPVGAVEDDLGFFDVSDEGIDIDSHPSESGDVHFGSQKFSLRLTISELARFSSMRRRSGTEFRFKRADSLLVESEYSDYQEELGRSILLGSLKIEEGAPIDIERFQSATTYDQLTAVQKRLVLGNILRRNRIVHATKNMRSSKAPPPPDPKETSKQLVAGAAEEKPSDIAERPMPLEEPIPTINPNQTQKKEAPSLMGSRMTGFTAQTATKIGQHFKSDVLVPKPTPSVATKVTRTGAIQDYPRCPEPISDEFIQCPYCADMLPACYTKNVVRWKGHVAQDILPYMCVFEDCNTPEEMYLTSDDLLKHAQDHHSTRQWVCNPCSRNPEQSGLSTFNTMAEWRAHTREAHKELGPDSSLAALAKFGEARVLQHTTCPLCGISTEGVQKTLDQHIVQHIHEGNLDSDIFADLPWSEETASEVARRLRSLFREYEDLGAKIDSRPRTSSLLPTLTRVGDMMCSVVIYVRCGKHTDEDMEKLYSYMSWRDGSSHTIMFMMDEIETEWEALKIEFEGFRDPQGNKTIPYLAQHVAANTLADLSIRPLCFDIPSRNDAVESHKSFDPLFQKILANQEYFIIILEGPSAPKNTSIASRIASDSHLRVFWVDIKASSRLFQNQFIHFDWVLAQIGMQLLEMEDLLDVLAIADRGPAFVEAMLWIMNQTADKEWVIVWDGVTTDLNSFFSGLQLPDRKIRGMTICTTQRGEIPDLPSCWMTAVDSIYPPPLQLFDDDDENSQEASDDPVEIERALQFMSEAKDVANMIRELNETTTIPPSQHCRQTKMCIAVVDTGIDVDDALIKAERGRIRVARGFVGDTTDYQDSHGHGTHVVRILLTLAPLAEICVAKISETSTIEYANFGRIIQAMEWAESQGAYMICLPHGKKPGETKMLPAMTDAIMRAPFNIFFVGDSRPRPRTECHEAGVGAYQQDGIVYVHACDGHGGDRRWSGRNLNFHLGTLGISIPSQWQGEDVFKSGASFAATITAALACNVLDIARLCCPSMSENEMRRLRTFDIVQAVLQELTVEVNGYDFLSPSALLEKDHLIDVVKRNLGGKI